MYADDPIGPDSPLVVSLARLLVEDQQSLMTTREELLAWAREDRMHGGPLRRGSHDDLIPVAIGIIVFDRVVSGSVSRIAPIEALCIDAFLAWAERDRRTLFEADDIWTILAADVPEGDEIKWQLSQTIERVERQAGNLASAARGPEIRARLSYTPDAFEAAIEVFNTGLRFADQGNYGRAIELFERAKSEALKLPEFPRRQALIACCDLEVTIQLHNRGTDRDRMLAVERFALISERDIPADYKYLYRECEGRIYGDRALNQAVAGLPNDASLQDQAHYYALKASQFEVTGLLGIGAEWCLWMALAAKMLSRQQREYPAFLGNLGRLSAALQSGRESVEALNLAKKIALEQGDTGGLSVVETNYVFATFAVGSYEIAERLGREMLEANIGDQALVASILLLLPEPAPIAPPIANDRQIRRLEVAREILAGPTNWLTSYKDILLNEKATPSTLGGGIGRLLHEIEGQLPAGVDNQIVSRASLYGRLAGRGWLYFFRTVLAIYPIRFVDWLFEDSATDLAITQLRCEVAMEWIFDPTGLHSTQRRTVELADRVRRLRTTMMPLLASPRDERLEALEVLYDEERLADVVLPLDELSPSALLHADPMEMDRRRQAAEAEYTASLRAAIGRVRPSNIVAILSTFAQIQSISNVRERRDYIETLPAEIRDIFAFMSEVPSAEDLGLSSRAHLASEAQGLRDQLVTDEFFAVEFVQTVSSSTVAIVRGDHLASGSYEEVSLHRSEISRQVLRETVATLFSDMITGDLSESGRDITSVLTAIMEPIWKLPEGSSLVLSPMSIFGRIAFESLPSGPAGERLSDRYHVMRKDGSRRWTALQSACSVRDVAVLSDPGGDLPYARREASFVHEALGGEILNQHSATLARVQQTLLSARIVHWTGHGAIDPVTGAPQLQLADGWFPVEAIVSSGCRQLDLVVLNACWAGASSPLGEESAVSAAQIFLDAGARAVISPLCPISSADAEAFGRDLAANLSGCRLSDALRRACREREFPSWVLFGADLSLIER